MMEFNFPENSLEIVGHLRTDSILHQWFVKTEHYNIGDRIFSHSDPRGPIRMNQTGTDSNRCSSLNESHLFYRLLTKIF